MERQKSSAAVRWARLVILYLLTVLVASAIFYVCAALTTPKLYVGRATLTLHPLAKAQPNAKMDLNDLAVIATSDKVFSQAESTLRLLNVSRDPQALLMTVKVEAVPGSQGFQIEVISPYREEATDVADIIAREVKSHYSEIVTNRTLDLGDARSFPATSEAIASTAWFAAYFAVALMLLLVGVGSGRRPGRLRRVVTIVSVVVFAAAGLMVGYNSMLRAPEYMGRVRILARPSAQAGNPSSDAKLLETLAKMATSKTVLRKASSTLRLLNVAMDPRTLLHTVTATPVPHSHVLEINVVSDNPIEPKAAADVMARELRMAYSALFPDRGSEEAFKQLRRNFVVIDDAAVFPVDQHKWISRIVAAGALIALLGIGIGRVMGRRRRGAAQE